MTPEALWAMSRIGGYQASPDGQHIVFQMGYYSVEENKSHQVLWMMKADGSEQKQLTTDADNDNMTVEVELAEVTDDYKQLQTLEKEIRRRLKDEILLTPIVRLVPRGTLPVSEGKAVRVVDKRKVYQ